MHGSHGDGSGCSGLADGRAVLSTGEDDCAPVVVDHPRPATVLAALPRCLQPVLRPADDVATAILGSRERGVEDQRPLGVLAGRNALYYLHGDAALEPTGQDDEPSRRLRPSNPAKHWNGPALRPRSSRSTTARSRPVGTTWGNLITSRSPDDLPASCDTIVAKFASNSTQGEVTS